ncbi:MAG: hypothetical protein LBQ31_00715 [Bacteroidales bacterium]|jgi:hypothetical protein|nr:hypothetical protein [Bacteroidales bacterium]
MKDYKDTTEETFGTVCEPVFATYEATHRQQYSNVVQKFQIPRDTNGKPIGIPWENVIEEMYDDLSTHYNVDLRTL